MTDHPLDIEVRPNGTTVTLVLSGELDIASGPTLRACLESIDDGFRDIVLDLSDLTFLDSTGVGVIAEARRRLPNDLCQLSLHRPRGHVQRVIELTGLATVLPVTQPAESDAPTSSMTPPW
jgi:anti-sigma B factor antagonist